MHVVSCVPETMGPTKPLLLCKGKKRMQTLTYSPPPSHQHTVSTTHTSLQPGTQHTDGGSSTPPPTPGQLTLIWSHKRYGRGLSG